MQILFEIAVYIVNGGKLYIKLKRSITILPYFILSLYHLQYDDIKIKFNKNMIY